MSTPEQEEVECLPLGAFFPEQQYVSLLDMLATVDHTTGFLDEFEHWQPNYQRARPPKKILFAGIIGYGCDIGHRKLAQISKQIDENTLDNAVNWYFSLQNVQGGNDRIRSSIGGTDVAFHHHQFRRTRSGLRDRWPDAHQFAKAISFGHNQAFIQSEKEDQEVAEKCRRLIKNAIVCWNYLYLSRELDVEKNEARRAELIKAIRHGSVVAWRYFNLHREFDFSDDRMVDSVGLMVPEN